MNKVKVLKIFIIILLVICIVLLTFTMFIFKDIVQDNDDFFEKRKNTSENNVSDNDNLNTDVEMIVEKEYRTLEEVFEEKDIEFLSINDGIMRVTFPKDLYNEDGSSNEKFFEELISQIGKFQKNNSFTLFDRTRNLKIYAQYNKSEEKYKIIINDIPNYFEEVDGELYAKVDKVKLQRSSNIFSDNEILLKLASKKSYFSAIESLVQEDEILENGYTSYNNGQILIRKSLIDTVKHILFTSKYDGKITSKIGMNTSLKEILDMYPKNSFGSVDKGYLGYITDDYYYFFYNNEVSVYSYTYSENKQFEKILKNYLESKDLNNFISGIQSNYRVYDYLEYDEEIQKANILFANRGIEIDIEENNPKGITLYTNYMLSDYTKKCVREGLITLNSYEDLINKKEMERRK